MVTIREARKVFGRPPSCGDIFKEVLELWEAIRNGDEEGFMEEASDVALFFQAWLSYRVNHDWQLGFGCVAHRKFLDRLSQWEQIFKENNLEFNLRYLVNGSNYKKPEKVRLALELAALEQRSEDHGEAH